VSDPSGWNGSPLNSNAWNGPIPCAVSWALLGMLTSAIVLLSLVPPVSRDALIHHLAVPKIYLRDGFRELPDFVFSYYPMNVELLYWVSLALGSDLVPKFIHFAFALGTAGLLFRHLRNLLGKGYGLAGALLFLSVPIVVKLSTTAYVDLGLVFFSTAALLAVLDWREGGFKAHSLVRAGVFCGLALGAKYNGLIAWLILSLFIPALYARGVGARSGGLLRSCGQGLLFALPALAVFSPWMIRNALWTGNPLYPLLSGWVGDTRVACGAAPDLFTLRAGLYGESGLQIALLPLRIFFEGQDGVPRFFDGRLNPFLLFLPPLAFLCPRRTPPGLRRENAILLLFSVLYFGFAFFSSVLRIRYLAPILPPLVILSVQGLRNLLALGERRADRRARLPVFILAGAIGCAALVYNAAYVKDLFRIVQPFSFLSKAVSRDAYISRVWSDYPALQYVNRELPPEAQILFLFNGDRGYYCDRRYRLDMHCNRSLLRETAQRAAGGGKLHEALRAAGLTHLLIRRDLFERWVAEEFTRREQQVLEDFLGHWTRILFQEQGYGVYELAGAGPSARATAP
jgi:4-amino-4-deoxy-L-arabinose transferase-like glycosyltransferase